MNRIAKLLGGGVLAAGLALGLGLGAGVFADEQEGDGAAASDGHEGHTHGDGEVVTIEGELIDTACFVASDGDARGEDHAECAAKCLGSGVPAAILPEGEKATGLMYLLTNPKPFAHHAGQTIRVEGTPHRDMKAVDVKKLYVQHDGEWEEVQLDDEHHQMSGGDEAEGAEHDHGDGHHENGDAAHDGGDDGHHKKAGKGAKGGHDDSDGHHKKKSAKSGKATGKKPAKRAAD